MIKYFVEYFTQFRKLLGRKLYYLLIFMSVVAFFEGIGITLFLPILQDGFGENRLSQILKAIFGSLGIVFSFTAFLWLILIFFVLRSVFLIAYARYFGRISSNLTITLRQRVLKNILEADYLYLLQKEVGYINNALMREVSCVVESFSTFSQTLSCAFYAIVYIALSILLNPKATLILATVSPLLIILARGFNLITNKLSGELSHSYGKFQSATIQALTKFKYFKATSSHGRISKIVEKENKKIACLRYRMYLLQALAKNIFEPLLVLVIVAILFYHVSILRKSVSEVIFLIFLFLQVARQFLNMQLHYRKFLAATGSIDVFNSLEKELNENKEKLNLDGALPEFDREIVFKDVNLTFPNGKRALDDVNIQIKPKSVVAVVGHSGSGKSTIANMVAGVLRPISGQVMFGSVNYKRLNIKALRENIGYVTQEDIVFNASIKDNISLWDENIDYDKLKKVIEIAHITSFVNGLSEKEDGMLSDNGLDVSGGQRQRITIARELYKNTKLLILDEATSSLDSKSEQRIHENLQEFKGEKTILIIAHRLSTIKKADYIYVMDNGRIVEEGTFDELCVNKDTKFYQLYELQKI